MPACARGRDSFSSIVQFKRSYIDVTYAFTPCLYALTNDAFAYSNSFSRPITPPDSLYLFYPNTTKRHDSIFVFNGLIL